MNHYSNEPLWRSHKLARKLPWDASPIRPSEIGDSLCEAALARKNLLEDAEYHKISPNWFVVEVSQENYQFNYLPLLDQILDQWRVRLLNCLMTANERQGRNEYRFGGAVRVEIRPIAGLKPSQARILCTILNEQSERVPAVFAANSSCLQSDGGGNVWQLRPGISTIGRNAVCDVFLDSPEIQRAKLVSGLHAYIYSQEGSYRMYDGSPDGRPSRNGTFVNLARVPQSGVWLKDGDQILLAATNPSSPDVHTSGVAVLWFRLDCY